MPDRESTSLSYHGMSVEEYNGELQTLDDFLGCIEDDEAKELASYKPIERRIIDDI